MRHLSLLLLSSLLCLLPSTASIEEINSKDPLVDGQTLISTPAGTFVLGFFSHDRYGDNLTARAGSGRYLGIWYGRIPVFTVVWTANPDNPVPSNSTGVLEIGPYGDLRVSDLQSGAQFWSSNSRSNRTAEKRVARLYDSGNLVLTEGTGGQDVLWQSSDHLFDTLTRGMKLGWDRRSGLNRYLRSWGGEANFSFDLDGVPQLFIRTSTSTVRVGFFDGVGFINRPRPTTAPDPVFHFDYQDSKDEVYYSVIAKNLSNVGRLKLDSTSGKLSRYLWDGQKWKEYWSYPGEQCDEYSRCGTFGVCTPDVTFCSCLPGFANEYDDKLNIRDASDRCVRRTPLDRSGQRDGFQMVPNLKLPDSRNAMAWPGMGPDECGKVCLANSSCTAYSILNFANNPRCIMWFGELRDIRAFPSGGLSLYLRLAASDIHTDPVPGQSNRKKKLILATVGVAFWVGAILVGFGFYKNNMKSQRKLKRQGTIEPDDLERANEECPLPSYTFMAITTATANFHTDNKLGQGAFGPVYHARLPNGEQVAVKRLSKSSTQGPKEFCNEIALIAKLQHKNLVRLLGCCVHGDERMLIYEFMPNKCLSSFLFDDEKCKTLDWKMRADIIAGIARGVDYLHHGSRLRIVHRDLKVGNILLDQKMNPKISDFGTARTLDEEVIKDSTVNVIGTYGYMSPEYVMDGIFSTKSDVYSFGIVVLEILSGTKNKVFPCMERTLTLPGYAWKLWIEGDIRDLADSRVDHSCPTHILRYIHIALLCVQEEADDRPEMYEVILMLGSESVELPQPKKPGFFTKINSSPNLASSCIREVSATMEHITYTNLEER